MLMIIEFVWLLIRIAIAANIMSGIKKLQTENRILREKLETYEKIKADMDKEESEE